MSKDFSKRLAGQIGEHLVVAELGRRNIIATPFAGNVPDIDILAYANERAVPIQVKAMRQAGGTVDATKYLRISFAGEQQRIDGLVEVDRSLVYVLVTSGISAGEDRFFAGTGTGAGQRGPRGQDQAFFHTAGASGDHLTQTGQTPTCVITGGRPALDQGGAGGQIGKAHV